MPQRKAAKKDLKQNKKRKQANLQVKRSIKDAAKKLKKTLAAGDSVKVQQALKEVCKLIDKAASKKVIHPNKAARRKSRINKSLKKKLS